MNKLSAYVITYNEEKNIRACLESIKWVDEIIVVDSYSTDNTVNQVKNYTNNIFFHKFENNLVKQRNFALSKTQFPWILTIDADETLSENAESIVRKLINNEIIEGYWFPRRNYISKSTYLKHGLFYPDWQLRLFKKKKNIYYGGPIHEKLDIPESKTVKTKGVEIIHNPSHTKYDSFLSLKKLFPYIIIEGNQLAKTEIPGLNLIFEGFIQFFKEFYYSFIKYRGFLDGYPGFRAAFIYALYKGSIYYYAYYKRFI